MATFTEDPELCTKFRAEAISKYEEGVASGLYDARDMERLKTDDGYVSCFIRAFSENGSLEEPLKMVDTIFRFRKEIQLNDLTADSFPKEVTEANCLFWKGLDKEGRKILHFRVSRNKKGVNTQDVKNFIAFTFNEHYKIKAGVRIVLIFDFTDAGITNMDLDISKFIITCLSTYFPCILQHILLFEMSFLLSTIWKIIKGWLSSEQQKKLIYVKKSDIQNYVAVDQLEPHMIK